MKTILIASLFFISFSIFAQNSAKVYDIKIHSDEWKKNNDGWMYQDTTIKVKKSDVMLVYEVDGNILTPLPLFSPVASLTYYFSPKGIAIKITMPSPGDLPQISADFRVAIIPGVISKK